jgi:PKD repeat protein
MDTVLFKIGTGDSIQLTNTSTSGSSVKWDLGNGTTATTNNVGLSFSKSGNYKVTLTITAKDGKAASLSKTVLVQDRVLKNIIINKVYWNTKPNQIDHFNYVWPESPTADLFVRMQVYKVGENIKNGLLTNSEVLYDSPLLSGVSNNSTTAININLSDPVLINKNMIDSRSLVLTLIAKDQNGKLYDIMSSMDSGCSWGFLTDNITMGQSLIQCQLFSSIQLVSTFK